MDYTYEPPRAARHVVTWRAADHAWTHLDGLRRPGQRNYLHDDLNAWLDRESPGWKGRVTRDWVHGPGWGRRKDWFGVVEVRDEPTAMALMVWIKAQTDLRQRADTRQQARSREEVEG